MKNLLLLLVVFVTLSSCESRYKKVQALDDGKIGTVVLPDTSLFKKGDTLLVKEGSSFYFYGKYIGVIPSDSIIHKYRIVKIID